MNIRKIIILMLCSIFISGCASNVMFYGNIEKNINLKENNKKSISIYVDAFGSIYPEAEGIKLFASVPEESGSLYEHFFYNKKICTQFLSSKESDIRGLCEAIKDIKYIDDFKLPNKNWRNYQTILWQKKGKIIFEEASKKNLDIIFLIHGFNNIYDKAKNNFSIIKKKIRSLIDKEKIPLIVEVYWDGFDGLPLSGAWSKAQSSGPLVGFQMRQLFKSIQDSYKQSNYKLPELMFITHSSGAFVAGSILGNPYSVLPNLHEKSKIRSPEYENFFKYRSGNNVKFPIPKFTKIRLGMIAAATPSNTFTGNKNMDSNVEGGILSTDTKLIFTINSKDIGLNKFFRLADVNLTGATGAGTDKEDFCILLKNLKEQENRAFDFSDGGFLFWNGHGVSSYLSRNNTNDFIKEVLGYKTLDYHFCSNN